MNKTDKNSKKSCKRNKNLVIDPPKISKINPSTNPAAADDAMHFKQREFLTVSLY